MSNPWVCQKCGGQIPFPKKGTSLVCPSCEDEIRAEMEKAFREVTGDINTSPGPSYEKSDPKSDGSTGS